MKIVYLLVVVCSLAGCMTAPKDLPKPLPLVSQTQTVVIPPELLIDCEPLSPLTPNTTYTQGQSVDVASTWAAEHRDCMLRFQKLRDLTAKAFNINIDEHGNEVPAVPTPASGVSAN
jgi:hypothetical protein